MPVDTPPRRTDLSPPAQIQWVGVAPLGDASPWFVPSLRAVASLKLLKQDWDGYGSPPIQASALEVARNILREVGMLEVPAPEISPVTGGGIHFRWQTPGKDADIEVLPSGDVEYLIAIEGRADQDEFTRIGRLPREAVHSVWTLVHWLTLP